MSALGLTGNTRYRISLLGKVVLQVEYEDWDYVGDCGFYTGTVTKWRDANFRDLQELRL